MLLIHVKIKKDLMTLRSFMKKLIISIMAVMLFLTGCGKSQEKATLEKDIDNLQKENKELKDKKEKLQQEKRKINSKKTLKKK